MSFFGRLLSLRFCSFSHSHVIHFPWIVSAFVLNSLSIFLILSQERFYFGDNILPCFESGIPLLLNRLQQLPDSDNVRFLQYEAVHILHGFSDYILLVLFIKVVDAYFLISYCGS